jgi:hypothetical protein
MFFPFKLIKVVFFSRQIVVTKDAFPFMAKSRNRRPPRHFDEEKWFAAYHTPSRGGSLSKWKARKIAPKNELITLPVEALSGKSCLFPEKNVL